jgi:hypothetical protein
MDNKRNRALPIVLTIIAILAILWALFHKSTPAEMPSPAPVDTVPAQTAPDTSVKTYIDTVNGFSFQYPATLTPENSFTILPTVQNQWRVNAPQASKGTALVAIPTIRFDQGGVATGKTYPLFYDAEVRVGVSNDTANCYATDAGYENQSVTTVAINGVNFKKFSFADAAMMKYLEGESYRTIRNGKCYAVERFHTGSSYRDDTMTEGKSQAELDAYYAQTFDIVQSFSFITPVQ